MPSFKLHNAHAVNPAGRPRGRGQSLCFRGLRMRSTQKSHVVYEFRRTETRGAPGEMSKAPPLTRSRAAKKKSRLSIAGRDTSSPSASSSLHGTASSPSSEDTDEVSGQEEGIVVFVSVRCFIAYGVSAMKKYMKVALASKRKKPKSKSSKKIALDDYYMVSKV